MPLRKKDEDKRNCVWCFKTTKSEMEMIKIMIDKHSINVSNFMRNALEQKFKDLENK